MVKKLRNRLNHKNNEYLNNIERHVNMFGQPIKEPLYKGNKSETDKKIEDINKKVEEINNVINIIIESIGSGHGIPVPYTMYKSESIDGTPLEVYPCPNYDDYDYIEITYTNGSSRQTSKFTVEELKGENAHPCFFNLNDNEDEGYFIEPFTRLVDGDKFVIEKIHGFTMRRDVSWAWASNNEESPLRVNVVSIIAYKYEKVIPDSLIKIKEK